LLADNINRNSLYNEESALVQGCQKSRGSEKQGRTENEDGFDMFH
jgi:hypothetical protein